MEINIKKQDLRNYTSAQLNNLFPDKYTVNLDQFKPSFNLALDRLENCYKEVSHHRYNLNGVSLFNYLYSDHYLMFVWFLANSVWKETSNENVASKLYYLNKTLHSFDCMYDTGLPDVFLIFHGAGTMLGKASYKDYFIAFQGCTVGSQKGKHPVMGKAVSLTAHSALIGDCRIGDRVTLSAYTPVFEDDIPSDSIIFKDKETGRVEVKKAKQCYAQQFFSTDLNQ